MVSEDILIMLNNCESIVSERILKFFFFCVIEGMRIYFSFVQVDGFFF